MAGAARLLGIVAKHGPLLMAVERLDRRIHIENPRLGQTDLLWKKTQKDIGKLLETISAKHMEEKEARDQLEAALTERFEEAFPAFIEV